LQGAPAFDIFCPHRAASEQPESAVHHALSCASCGCLSVRHRIGKPSVGSRQWNAHGTAAQAFFSRSAAGSATSYNEHGVQIMTPAYEGDRATPKIVLKNRWFAPPATPSAPSPSPDS
jgi:hypothetical protein